MKSEFFLRALSDLDDALILEAQPDAARRTHRIPRAYAAAAACFVFLAGALALVLSGQSRKLADSVGENLCEDFSYYCAADTAQAEAAPDTAPGESLTAVTFRFFDGTRWTARVQEYPDGAPDAASVLSDYLSAAGSAARCVSVRVEETGAQDNVLPDGLLEHTVGKRCAYVELDGDPGENAARGLVNTVLRGGLLWADLVCISTPGGALSIDGNAPAGGFAAFPEDGQN